MRDRIIQINGPFEILTNDRFRCSIQYLSESKSLIDADIVFVDMKNVETHIESEDAVSHDEKLIYWRTQLIEHLKSGKSIVLFMNGSLSHFNLENQNGTSKYIRKNKEFLLPEIEYLIEDKFSGVNIEMSKDTVFRNDWLMIDDLELFKYSVVIPKRVVDVPLMKIKGTNKIVGGVRFFEKGKIIYLPSINDKAYQGPLKNQLKIATQIVNFSNSLDLFLQSWNSKELPDWLDSKKIVNEVQIEEKIKNIEFEIQKLEELKGRFQKEKDEIIRIKSILVLSGKALEENVTYVFEKMGIERVKNLENNRVDLILRQSDKYIVCEVKGVAGSAKESFAAQLEKWSSEFYEENTIIPKGLLIVATFNSTEFEKRDNKDFPPQMLKYVNLKSQACLTTNQLLLLYDRFVKGEMNTDDIFSLLYESVGVVKV